MKETYKLERIQKIISRSGIASRRMVEKWIGEGLVTVNGKIANLGVKVNPEKDSIKVRNKLINPLIKKKKNYLYLALYKPRGVICSMDKDLSNRKTISDFINIKTKMYVIGKISFDSEGLVILTNNGEILNKVQSSNMLIMSYIVKLSGNIYEKQMKKLTKSLRLDGHVIKPVDVSVISGSASKTILSMKFYGVGPLRVKEFIEKNYLITERIKRIGFGPISLLNLNSSESRFLSKKEIKDLNNI